MRRPAATRPQKRDFPGTLRIELQRQIELGNCAYCGTSAGPGSPLTREHVIPRARGGRRKDVRIIVPACARCNHNRGCRELIPFLLTRPQRISAFLDYLVGLTPESIRQIDLRVYAELYAAVAILHESTRRGAEWRGEMKRLCTGRSLHRRRYAARRVIWAIAGRFGGRSEPNCAVPGPSCPLWPRRANIGPLHLDEPLDRLAARLLGLFSLLWAVPAEIVAREMMHELTGSAVDPDRLPPAESGAGEDQATDGVFPLDGWAVRRRRKRLRVDRRQGRPARGQRGPNAAGGRAA